MGFIAAATALSFVFAAAQSPQPQKPATEARPLPLAVEVHPEVVLSDATDPVSLTEFGLGNGGLDLTAKLQGLRWCKEGCTTPGGILVEVRAVGVKLTFPSGRLLLLAADGCLHLRDGSAGGPFPHGLELRLGDGSSVRILLSQAQRIRVRDVVVLHRGRALQPWMRGRAARRVARTRWWGGVRVCCCGDGGDLYRAIAIGPLVTLERVLVPRARKEKAPQRRLVVLTSSLESALGQVSGRKRLHGKELRRSVTTVAAAARRSDAVFPDGAALRRVERDSLRWRLSRGYELELALDGPRAPRLALFAGRSRRPMVEWVLGTSSAAFLNNPLADEPGAPRWSGNGVRMPTVVSELQARTELNERTRALWLIQQLN